MKLNRRIKAVLMIAALLCAGHVSAQTDKMMYGENMRLRGKDKGNLTLRIDNLDFFQNNETPGNRTDGYTLPGFVLQPTIGYQPLRNVKVEAGFNMRYFWTSRYNPVIYFSDVMRTVQSPDKRKVNIVPFIRAHVQLAPYLSFVFGNIYGGTNHGLPEPLYDNERMLTQRPETGLQILLNTRHFDADAWVNWENFIYRGDGQQEAFTFGVAAKVKVNEPRSKVHVSFPLNVIYQHRGGEIDTLTTDRVQTWMNASAGISIAVHPESRLVRNVEFQALGAAHADIKGEMLPYQKGAMFYCNALTDIWRFRVSAGYSYMKNFISLLGNPYFGTISVPYDGRRFKNPQLGTVRVEYTQRLGAGCMFAMDLRTYFAGKCDCITSEGNTVGQESAIGVIAGAYFRFNPTILLKHFGRRGK